MTTQEACEKFNINKRELLNLCKNQTIPAYKANKKWVIPDNIPIILNKSVIKYIIVQIINLKNNINFPYSKRYFKNIKELRKILEFIRDVGYINHFNEHSNKYKNILSSCVLTNEGINLVLYKDFNKPINLHLNLNLNFGSINL